MSNGRASAVLVASIAWPATCAAAHAQAPVKIGSEFAVNTYTSGEQYDPTLATAANGDFVVAWTNYGRDGSSYGVFARRFDSTGAPQSGEFQVNSYTNGTQNRPAVGRDNAGNFVIAWTSFDQDGSVSGVFARRFNAAGVAQAVEFQANSYTTNAQGLVGAAMAPGGDFVLVWQSEGEDGATAGVFGRRFNLSGAPQGAEFQVNSYTTGSQGLPALDLETNGDFVVVWHSQQDASSLGIFGQRFNAAGAKQGPEFQANTYQTGAQSYPAVGTDADGDFIIAWQSGSQDGFGYGVFARRFDSSGAPQGGEFGVNLKTAGDEGRRLAIDVDADGDFVIAWESLPQDGSSEGIFARRFKASGVAQSGDLQVNTYTLDSQSWPAVSARADGDFVIAWNSGEQDGYGAGVFAQRFDVPMVLDIDGDGVYGPLTDGLLVLRHAFGFTGATLTSGAVGANCTRCDATSILPYLQSLL